MSDDLTSLTDAEISRLPTCRYVLCKKCSHKSSMDIKDCLWCSYNALEHALMIDKAVVAMAELQALGRMLEENNLLPEKAIRNRKEVGK